MLLPAARVIQLHAQLPVPVTAQCCDTWKWTRPAAASADIPEAARHKAPGSRGNGKVRTAASNATPIPGPLGLDFDLDFDPGVVLKNAPSALRGFVPDDLLTQSLLRVVQRSF